MRFEYNARTPDGGTQTGIIEAPDVEAAISRLQQHDLVLVSIDEADEGIGFSTEIKFLARITKEDVVLFSRQLSVLFDAQVPLLKSLRTLAHQTENPKFRDMLLDIADEVDAGTQLSDAMAQYPKAFSRFYVSVMKAGEASGRLEEVLNYLADHEEKNYDLTKKVQGALIYPAFIIFSLFAVGAIMMIFVIPQLTDIFEESGADLPILTQIVMGISGFLQAYWWLVIVGLIGAAAGGTWYVRTPQGRVVWDTLMLNIPILKDLFQKLYIARLSENLATLIKGGIPIIQALTITGSVVGNSVYETTIKEAGEVVQRGGSMSSVMKENKYIPPLVVQMVSVGEETGKIDMILEKVASFYQKDVDNMVNNLTALIQPILILVLGAAAGLLVAAILLPVYNLSGQF